MSEAGRGPRFVQGLWQAVRFLFFGVGGFLITIGSLIFVMEDFAPGGVVGKGTVLAAIAFIAGAFMMLYGVGEWGKWAYLWVFVSIPLVFVLEPFLPKQKELGFFLPIAAAVISFSLVRWHYRRKAARAG